VHAVHENHDEYRFEGTRYNDDEYIYEYEAKMYLTNMKNLMTTNLKSFMKHSIIAPYPDLVRQGIWAIINGVRNDRKNEEDIEFVDEKTSRKRTNEASVIHATMKEHRSVLGLVNTKEKVSDMKKDNDRCYRLILQYFVFLDRELERKAEKELSSGKMTSG